MKKPTKEEVKALVLAYGDARIEAQQYKRLHGTRGEEFRSATIAFQDRADAMLNSILDAIFAEVPTDQATKLAECKLVTFFAAQALKRSRGHANPKRDWDTVFKSFTEAADRYSLGNATAEDRAALGLPKREVTTDAS